MNADDLDPTALLNPLRTGLKLVRVLQRWNDGPERASIYRDHYEEWIAELAQALRAHVDEAEVLAERLDTLEQDRERLLVLGNLGFEAWREAVDARRVMLGDAAVAAVFSELSASALARIERTVRMLDPEDLELLALIVDPERCRIPDDVVLMREPLPSEERYMHLVRGHLGGAALVAAGCVRVGQFEGAQRLAQLKQMAGGDESIPPILEAEITPLGELVLRFMGRAQSEAPTGAP